MKPGWGEHCEKGWSFLTGMCFLWTGCVSKSHCWELLIKHNWCDEGKGDRSLQAQEDYGKEKSLQEIRLKWKVTQNELAVVEQTNMWVQPAVFPVEEDLPLGPRCCTNITKGHFRVFLTSEGLGTCHLPALLKHKERVTVPKRCNF